MIITKDKVKIGVIGICEPEWVPILNLNYQQEGYSVGDPVKAAKEISAHLKAQGCEFIIALTHMGLINDRKFVEQVQDEVDLVLGGHDHLSVCEKIGRIWLVKSGSDFEEFSDITFDLNTGEMQR